MAAEGLLILDNSSPSFQYIGEGWTTRTTSSDDPVQWYGGTATYHSSATVSSGPTDSLSLTFEGTGVALFGATFSNPFSSSFTVAIDGGEPYNVVYDAEQTPPSFVQWFQTPALKDGSHNLSISRLEGLVLDYAVVSAGPKTPTRATRAIVDNDSRQLDFSGSWARNTGAFSSSNSSRGMPFRNVTHHSWTVGDSFSFVFIGTAVSVHGIFSWSTLGDLSVAYTLDGSRSELTYSVNESSPEYINRLGDSPNFVFFARDDLSAGQHTLTGNITRTESKTFVLDYVTYVPSFDTFPVNFFPTSSRRVPKPTSKPTSSLQPNDAYRLEQKSARKPLETILGSTFGAIAFCVIVALLVLFILKRRKSSRLDRHSRQNSGDSTQPLMSETMRTSVLPAWVVGRQSSDSNIVTPFLESFTPREHSSPSTLSFERTLISTAPHMPAGVHRERPLLPQIITTPSALSESPTRPQVYPNSSLSLQPLTPLRRPLPEPMRSAASLPFFQDTFQPSVSDRNGNTTFARFSAPVRPHQRLYSEFPSPQEPPHHPSSAPGVLSFAIGSRPMVEHPDMRIPCSPPDHTQRLTPQTPLVPARRLPTQPSTSNLRSVPSPLNLMPNSAPLRPTIDGNERLPETPVGVQRRPPSSPLGPLIPRLASMIGRVTPSRQSSTEQYLDINEEGNPPPAYHTISARQSRLLAQSLTVEIGEQQSA